MDQVKQQLYQLQANIDAHTGQPGSPCPTCGVQFIELAEGLEELVRYEIRKRTVIDPDIEEGEIVKDNSNYGKITPIP